MSVCLRIWDLFCSFLGLVFILSTMITETPHQRHRFKYPNFTECKFFQDPSSGRQKLNSSRKFVQYASINPCTLPLAGRSLGVGAAVQPRCRAPVKVAKSAPVGSNSCLAQDRPEYLKAVQAWTADVVVVVFLSSFWEGERYQSCKRHPPSDSLDAVGGFDPTFTSGNSTSCNSTLGNSKSLGSTWGRVEFCCKAEDGKTVRGLWL